MKNLLNKTSKHLLDYLLFSSILFFCISCNNRPNLNDKVNTSADSIRFDTEQNLITKLDSFENLIAKKNLELSLLEKEIENKSRKKTTIHSTQKSIRTNKDSIKNEISDLKNSFNDLSLEKKEIKKQYLKEKKKFDSIQQKFDLIKREKEKQKLELESLKLSLQEHNAKLADQNKEKINTIQVIDSLNRITNNNLNQIKEYESLLNAQKKKIEEITKEKTLLELKIDNITNELKNSKSTISNDINKSELENEKNIFSEKLKHANYQLDSAKNAHEKQNKLIKTLQLENNELKNKLSFFSSEKQKYQSSIDSLESLIHVQKQSISQINSEPTYANEESTNQKQVIDSLQKILINKKEQYDIINIQLKEKDNMIAELETNYAEQNKLLIEQEKKKIEKQFIINKNKIDSLQQIYDESTRENEKQNSELLKLKASIFDYEAKLLEQNNDKQRTIKVIDSLNIISNNNQNQLDDYKSLLSSQKKKLKEITNEKALLELKIDSISNKLNNQNSNVSNSKTENELQNERMLLTKRLDLAILQLDSIKKSQTNQDKLVNELQSENNSLKNKMSFYNIEKQKNQTSIDSLKSLIQVQTQSINKINTEPKYTNKESKNDKFIIDSLQKTLVNTIEQYELINNQLQEKDNVIADLESSYSSQNELLFELEHEKDSIYNQLIDLQSDYNLQQKKFSQNNNEEQIEENNSFKDIDFDSAEEKTKNGKIYYPLNTARLRLKLNNKEFVEKYIESYIESYLRSKATLELFELKEYFFFYIDTLGKVGKIEDQRTAFNNNTKILKAKNLEDLKEFRFNPVFINKKRTPAKASIGIIINIKHTSYEYKVQKDKIRVYKTPMYVEYVEPGNLHYPIISDTIKDLVHITDKFKITIIDGSYSVVEFAKKEYNPFEKKKTVLLKNDILKITKLRGIR